jgi:SAM-dependent methyltransferase
MKERFIRFLYRYYRKLKLHALTHPRSLRARLLFWPLEILRKSLGKPEKRTMEDGPLRKALYFLQYGLPREGPLFRVETDYPLASDSHDYQWPRGAIYDNNRNKNFNLKLYHFFNHKPDLKLLDLGCAGGGFVRSILEDGYTAIGLEGSDQPYKLRLAEWDTIPLHLFPGDITRPFCIKDSRGEEVKFDCITAWEVLEHIPESRLATLFANVVRHLGPGGIFVGSVDSYPDADPFTGAVYHVTLHERPWWEQQFHKAGLVPVKNAPFVTQDYVRGHGKGMRDWDPKDGGGFHFVLAFDKSIQERSN